MWEIIKSFLYYPIIDWRSQPVFENDVEIEPSELIFALSPLNIVLFIVIYLLAKLFIKYIKRYFKALQLTEKQLKIEGKEIAIWKLTKQLIYLLAIYLCFLSLKINNPQLDLAHILEYEFFRIKSFHIAVYHLFLTGAIVFITRISLNFIKVFLLKAVRKGNKEIDSGTEYIYVQLAKYVIYAIAIIAFLRSLGVDLDLFMTAAALFAVAIALGLQQIFQDYFSGILLLLEGSIKVGDVLEITQMNGQENFIAKVVRIHLRTSQVLTRDEKILVIPNSKLTQESVIDWSTSSSALTRFSIPITFHYGVDTELVKKILIECAVEHSKVSKARKPIVRLLNFGQDGLEMDLIFWAKQELYFELMRSDIRFAMDRRLREAGIEIPYPQRKVHFTSLDKQIKGEDPLNKDPKES